MEDDPDQLSVRAMLLEAQGFSCMSAADAAAARRGFEQASADGVVPECVLMDLNIPAERDGLQLIQWLESLPQPPAILLLSGSRIGRLRTRPELAKVAAFIEKGSPASDLIATLKRVCGGGTV